jgi:hypothetical protein
MDLHEPTSAAREAVDKERDGLHLTADVHLVTTEAMLDARGGTLGGSRI